MVSALYAFLARWVWRQRDGSVAVLALSSSLFVVFWLADPQGSVRKELITYLALCVYLSGLSRDRLILQWAGCVLFVLSVAAHEATVLFYPVFVALAVLSRQGNSLGAGRLVVLLVTLVFALACAAYGFLYSHSVDPMRVCQPLLERGLSSHMCNGAISWLGRDAADATNRVVAHTGVKTVSHFVVGYVVSLLPGLYIALHCTRPRLACGLVLTPVLFFLPLFPVGFDHGRWIGFHAMAAFVLCYAALRFGVLAMRQPIQLVSVGLLAVVSLLLVHGHMRWMVWGGVLRNAVDTVVFS